MSINLSTEATVEVEIEPTLKVSLRKNLKLYASLKEQAAAAKEAVEAQAAHIEHLRDQTGAKSVWLDGYGRVTRVDGGTTKTLDRKKLLAQGVSQAMLENATVEKPRRAFTKISLPGEREVSE